MTEGRYWSTELQRWVYPGEVQLPPPRVVHYADTQQELHYYSPDDVRALVLAERERCATLVDGTEALVGAVVHDIARAIRDGQLPNP